MNTRIASAALGVALLVGGFAAFPAPASADTTSTAAIIAGAASIVGALLYDSSNHPYYVRNNRRYYVTQNEERYYRGHHRGTMRQAYVPEREYPIARNPYASRGQQMQPRRNMHHDGDGHSHR